MISSTSIPARYLVREPLTRKECIVNWSGRLPSRKRTCWEAVIRAVERGREPRPPSVVTTGKRCPAVKSYPIRCAADMYAVTTRQAHVPRQTRSANTPTASLECRRVSPNSKFKIKPLDSGSLRIFDPIVKESSYPLRIEKGSAFTKQYISSERYAPSAS